MLRHRLRTLTGHALGALRTLGAVLGTRLGFRFRVADGICLVEVELGLVAHPVPFAPAQKSGSLRILRWDGDWAGPACSRGRAIGRMDRPLRRHGTRMSERVHEGFSMPGVADGESCAARARTTHTIRIATRD